MPVIRGTDDGLSVSFGKTDLEGKLHYGFIPFEKYRYPMVVYFKRTAGISKGKAFIPIKKRLSGKYDMIGWEKSGRGMIGYRVINASGRMLYDGRIAFSGKGPFKALPTIIEGPFVNRLSSTGATISFTTQVPIACEIRVNEQILKDSADTASHEIEVTGLRPGTEYSYSIRVGEMTQSWTFRTAPKHGSRKSFTFSYASDSREGKGGGERSFLGVNRYVMNRIMALNAREDVVFMQFTGDMINGYLADKDAMNLEFANWKRSIEPWAHYFPVYVGFGNHEVTVRKFSSEASGNRYSVNRFPFKTDSSERLFADNFVLPLNGPESEDGAIYDPDPDKIDFPSYKENVFFYTYGNVAIVVLNTDYLYTPPVKHIPLLSGNLHSYIMDQQLAWLKKTLSRFEKDKKIDHVFVTQHTPVFPCGGHLGDAMWFRGNNTHRAWINGKPLKQGIIERRDAFLDLLVNQSKKVRAVMTGDEHNYCKLEIGPKMNKYPEQWDKPKLILKRTIYQINNGAAGAPYYAREETPWSSFVSGFSTQNALVLFDVKGKKIQMRVINPVTLEVIDGMKF